MVDTADVRPGKPDREVANSKFCFRHREVLGVPILDLWILFFHLASCLAVLASLGGKLPGWQHWHHHVDIFRVGRVKDE